MKFAIFRYRQRRIRHVSSNNQTKLRFLLLLAVVSVQLQAEKIGIVLIASFPFVTLIVCNLINSVEWKIQFASIACRKEFFLSNIFFNNGTFSIRNDNIQIYFMKKRSCTKEALFSIDFLSFQLLAILQFKRQLITPPGFCE